MKKTLNLKVLQLENKNQFVIETNEKRYFQSYDSLVAIYDKQKQTLLLGRDWDYSNTTKKHLYIFIFDYCYLPTVEQELKSSRNKTKTMRELIKNKVVKYDENIK